MEKIHIKQLENSVREFSKIFYTNLLQERKTTHIYEEQLKTFLRPVFINNLIHC